MEKTKSNDNMGYDELNWEEELKQESERSIQN